MVDSWTQQVSGQTSDYVSDKGDIKIFTLKKTRFGGEVIAKQILCQTNEEAARKMNEGRIAQSHRHPSIVEVLDFAEEPAPEGKRYVYVIMRKMPHDLGKEAERRKSQTPIDHFREERLWKILKDLVSAFAFLQEKDFAHRDIKPQNILMDASGTVKICDFGFARKVEMDAVQMFTLAGTVPFFSPLLRRAYIQGEQNISRVMHNVYKSDVYSLGITMMYLTILEVPAFVTNLRDLQKNIERRLDHITNYSDQWVNAIRYMLAVEEAKRPDFLQLRTQLENSTIPVQVDPSPNQHFNDDQMVNVAPQPEDIAGEPLNVAAKCGVSVLRVSPTLQEEVPCMITLRGGRLMEGDRRNADIVCVIDVSGSMSGSKMRLVQNTLSKLVQILGPSDRVSIVTFNDASNRCCPLTACDPPGRALLLAQIAALRGQGNTNISAGLITGIQIFAERRSINHTATLLLFSDGENNRGPEPVSTCMEAVHNLESEYSLTVHTFGYGSEIDTDLMLRLAVEGKGQFQQVNNEEQVKDAFAVTLGSVLSVVARNLQVRVSLNKSCSVPCKITKLFTRDEEDFFSIPLLTADQRKDLIFMLKPDLKSLVKAVIVSPVKITLKYLDHEECEVTREEAMDVKFVPWEGERSQGKDGEVFANWYRVKGAECLKDARRMADGKNFQEAFTRLSHGIDDLSSSGFEQSPIVSAVISDMEQAKSLVTSDKSWSANGNARFASIAYSHYSQSAVIGAFQYATRQQERFRQQFLDVPR